MKSRAVSIRRAASTVSPRCRSARSLNHSSARTSRALTPSCSGVTPAVVVSPEVTPALPAGGGIVPGFWMIGWFGSRTMTSGSWARARATAEPMSSATAIIAGPRAKHPLMKGERSTMGAGRADGSRRLRCLLLLEFDDRELEIVEERIEQPRLVRRQVPARLDLEGLQKIDHLPGAVEVHLDLAREGVGHFTQIGGSGRGQVANESHEMGRRGL